MILFINPAVHQNCVCLAIVVGTTIMIDVIVDMSIASVVVIIERCVTFVVVVVATTLESPVGMYDLCKKSSEWNGELYQNDRQSGRDMGTGQKDQNHGDGIQYRH